MQIIDVDIWSAALRALKSIPKIPIGVWARKHIRLPDNTSKPGPLQLSKLQEGIAAALDCDDTRIVAAQLSAQLGKTTLAMAWLMREIHRDSSLPMMLLMPSDKRVKNFVRTTLDPIIARCAVVRDIVGKGEGVRTNGGDAVQFKHFSGGGFLVAGSAAKSSDTRGYAVSRLVADEIAIFPTLAKEGDSLELALRRLSTFRDSKALLVSTPTIKGSRISTYFERGSQHRFCLQCEDCGAWDHPRFDNIVYKKGDEKNAMLACAHCGSLMSNAQRLRALEKGEWRSFNAAAEPGLLSFHANTICSPWESLESIVRAYEACEGLPHKLAPWWNTWMGESYEADALRAEAETLQEWVEDFGGVILDAVRYLVVSVDTQDDRLEVALCGFDGAGEQWILAHEKIMGYPGDLDVWRDLDAYLARTFRKKNGERYPIASCGIDAMGHFSSEVGRFVVEQRAKGRAVIALKGQGMGRGGKNSFPTIWRSGTLKGICSLYSMGSDANKHHVTNRLLRPPGKEGRIHLSDKLSPEFIEQLCAEEWRIAKGKSSGELAYRWVLKPGVTRNEAFDLACMAYALSTITKPVPPLSANGTAQTTKRSAGEIIAALNNSNKHM